MRFFIWALATLALPAVALAAPLVGAIVPACGVGGAVPCQACDLVKLADNLLRFGVMFSVFAASVMFAYAGVLYVSASANKGNIDSAKNIFSSVFIGLLLVLGAWLIIDLGMRVFTKQPLTVWTNIQCLTATAGSGGISYTPNGQTQSVEPTTPTTPGGGTPASGEKLSDADARAYAKSKGLFIGDDVTTMNGTSKTTIDNAAELAKACGCKVTLTSTTGGDHTENGACIHSAGCKFDARTKDDGAALKAWVQSNLRETIPRSNGDRVYLDKCDNRYAIETGNPPHLDVTAAKSCPGII